MVTAKPELIYKIVTRDIAEAPGEGGTVPQMPIDLMDGYVHLSTAAQLPETLALHFRGRDDLVLLAVRTAELGDSLRWEPSRGGDLFPHLYAPLPKAAIAWSAPVAVGRDGSVDLPADVV